MNILPSLIRSYHFPSLAILCKGCFRIYA